MRDIALILHFLGLIMGLGTSFAYMFLGIAAAKMEKEEARAFQMKVLVLSKMGTIGIILLWLSGLYLITPYWSSLAENHLLITKLVFVVVLTVLIVLLLRAGTRAQTGDSVSALATMEKLGKIALLTGLAILILAVKTFH